MSNIPKVQLNDIEKRVAQALFLEIVPEIVPSKHTKKSVARLLTNQMVEEGKLRSGLVVTEHHVSGIVKILRKTGELPDDFEWPKTWSKSSDGSQEVVVSTLYDFAIALCCLWKEDDDEPLTDFFRRHGVSEDSLEDIRSFNT